MTKIPYKSALVIGAGPRINAAGARQLAQAGLKIALAAGNTEKLANLAAETGALSWAGSLSK